MGPRYISDFPRKDHADPPFPPQNVTKLFTGLLQPTLQEGTGIPVTKVSMEVEGG